MRRRSILRWTLGVVVLGLVAAGAVGAVRQQRRAESMRRNLALLMLNAARHGGVTDGSARRVAVGGVLTSKDGRVTIRVRAISAARVDAVLSVGSDPPEAITLPTPGAPIETIALPGGYTARVLEFDGATVLITVKGPHRSRTGRGAVPARGSA